MKSKNDKLICCKLVLTIKIAQIFSLIFTTDIYPVQVIQVTEHRL